MVRLDVNYGKKTIKNTNIWRLKNTLWNNQQIPEEIKEIKICIEKKRKYDNPKPVGFSKSSAKGKVRSNTNILQEIREKSNK